MRHLLDANVLVALVVTDHVHHEAATTWFGASRPFATCPITQGALLRLLIREGASSAAALDVLATLTRRHDHEFWPDDVPYDDADLTRVVGHRQVTDAYLAQLARARSARLATLDDGTHAAHPDVAERIGESGWRQARGKRRRRTVVQEG